MGEARRKLQGLFNRKPVHKTGVLLALPSIESYNRIEHVMSAFVAGAASFNPSFPYIVQPYPVMERYPVADARNDCTQYFMEQTQHEYLMFWDHDMVPPENWLALIGKGDIVSGWTLMWNGSRAPQKRLQVNQFKVDQLTNVSETLLPIQKDTPYEVDIVGTACMAIHRRVFERLGPRPFKEPVGPDGRRAMGEDMAFCREARAAGFKITIIPSVLFNHVKTVGLYEVYEALLAYAEAGRRAGYAQAMQEMQAGEKEGAA